MIEIIDLILVVGAGVLVFIATTAFAQVRAKQLEKLIIQLRNRVTYVEKTSQTGWPVAYWVKDNQGVMLSCSEEFEKEFLLPRQKTKEDCIGRKDHEIWGDLVSDEFSRNDATVRRLGKSLDFIEFIPSKYGVRTPYFVTKFPVKFDNTTIGVAGIATAISTIDELKSVHGV